MLIANFDLKEGEKMPKKHELKTLPEYFNAVNRGLKTFEIRKNDRGFEVGDTLILKEIFTSSKEFTGRSLERKITYITDYAQQENYVVMAMI
jgi:ASC-1-like (ASCH) protein